IAFFSCAARRGPDVVAATAPPPPASVLAAASAAAGTTPDSLLAKRRVAHVDKLPYDPRAAVNLAAIQKSHVALTDGELGLPGKNGFVVSTSKTYPSFTYGYRTIYADDLPVFVSADSILYAMHASYDKILQGLELDALAQDLETMLLDMRARIAAGGRFLQG